ncbi:Glycosyltransferase domain-containing protein [Desulfonema limicola]|uniref:Glycosyltransferase domain-containing protein n=1 Tax=Desulfonema limicola TaxID=45656 RepID=A0A975GGE6_9BACT|nr:glycosyltransferase family 39 protein [Desulfonema limicola]QTA80187.1 Glycosyltransferase domain-containing protein [Desulfonema limicola]
MKYVFVFISGFLLRLYACFNIPIINLDGIHYIYQAKAIYYGKWDSITSCLLKYISNYPVFIAGAYTIFNDWIIAARFVSLLFGTASLIMFFFLVKHFFDHNISLLCTLIFAMMPVMVRLSADIFRGSICTFFIISGLYFFTVKADKKNIFLTLACFSFLMAAWARIEALLFFIVTGLYILLTSHEKKIKRFVFFVSPIIIIIFSYILCTLIFDSPAKNFHRMDELSEKLTQPLKHYNELRQDIKSLSYDQEEGSLMFEFLEKLPNLLWLIALGTILNDSLETFFYPFVPIFLFGIIGIRKELKKDPQILLYILLTVSGFLLLYVHIMHRWIMIYRFFIIVIIPSFIFAGFGLQKTIRFLSLKYGIKESSAVLCIGLLIFAAGLPKNLKPRETDKGIYKQLGEIAAKKEDNDRLINIAAAPSAIQQWVTFYANMNYQGVFCPINSEIRQYNYHELITYLKKNKIKYFLWEENKWPIEKIDFLNAPFAKAFKVLAREIHPDSKRIILFELL